MNIEERNTNTFDIVDLTANLRKADRLEVETITGTTQIYNKLKDSILKSSYAKSFLVDGKVAGVYGVSNSPYNKHIGYPYLLCTNETSAKDPGGLDPASIGAIFKMDYDKVTLAVTMSLKYINYLKNPISYNLIYFLSFSTGLKINLNNYQFLLFFLLN